MEGKYSWQGWKPDITKEKNAQPPQQRSWQNWKPNIEPPMPKALKDLAKKSPNDIAREEFDKVKNSQPYKENEAKQVITPSFMKPLLNEAPPQKKDIKLPTFNPAQQKVYEEAGEVVPNKHVDAYHPMRKILSSYDKQSIDLYHNMTKNHIDWSKDYTKEQRENMYKYIDAIAKTKELIQQGRAKLEDLPEYMRNDIIADVQIADKNDTERLQKDKEYQEGIKNPVGKFLERTSRVASNTFLGSDYNYVSPANGGADITSNIAGTIIGYGTNMPGVGASQLSIANNMVGAPTEAFVSKATSKIGNKALRTVLPMAARGATEGASLAGIQGVQQGKDINEIGKDMLIQGVGGAILDPLAIGGFNALGKAGKYLSETIQSKVFKAKKGIIEPLTEAEIKIIDDLPQDVKQEVMQNPAIEKLYPKAKNYKTMKPMTLVEGEAAATVLKEPPQFKSALPQIEPSLNLNKARERGFNKSLKNDINLDEEFRNELKNNPLTYDPITNKETYASAEKEMAKGFDFAMRKFNNSDFENSYKPSDLVLGELLIRQAADNGNIQLARELTGDLAAKLTDAGQFIQAASILRRGEPSGFMVFMQRQLNKINDEGVKKLGKKWNAIDLTDNEIKLVQTMTKDNADNIQDQIFSSIAQRMPSTNMEKINSWRRTAMLLNPLTHVRNIGGNTLMAGMRKTADSVAAVMESAIPQAKRTKSIGWSKDKVIKALVDEDWDNVKKSLTGNNDRWNIQSTLGREKRIFKNPILEKLNKFSGSSLEAEDIPFMNRSYKDALGGFMKARGLKEVSQEARDYAMRRALEATYKDLNVFSKVITKLKKGSGIIGEAALPFAKTPANITVRAFEYSPAGLIKSLAQAAIDSRKGTFNPATFIEQFSKGITGTVGLTTLGFFLADAGIITGSPDSDKDKAAFDKAVGKLPYAIRVGGKYYSYEWAQPLAISLAMGAEIRNSIQDNDGLLETIKNSMVAGGDTLFNTSVLTNIKNLFGGYYDSPTEAVMETLGQLPKQMVPTVGGQVARIVDPVERVSFEKDPVKNFTNYVKSRTPGATQSMTPRIDIKGQEVTHGGKDIKGYTSRILQNFFNPARVGTGEMTPVDKEIDRLYNQSGKKDIFPRVSPNYFTDKTIKYELTTEEKAQWQRTMGQYTYRKINELILSPRYKLLQDYSDNSKTYTRAKAINGIIEDAYEKAKAEYLKNNKK